MAVVIGCVAVIGLTAVSASWFSGPTMPVLAAMSAFLLTGITAGALSREETILEPGLASLVVSAVALIGMEVFPTVALGKLSTSDAVLVLSNGIILSFVGAWAGEMLQSGAMKGNSQHPVFWNWISVGIIVGMTFNLILASVLVVILRADLTVIAWFFLLGILLTGFLVGWRSPGRTITEAAISGFISVIICIDIVQIVLVPVWGRAKLIGVVLGIVIALFGAWIGESMTRKTKAAA